MNARRLGTFLVPFSLMACDTGSGSASRLAVESSTLDFGDVLIGSSRTRDLTITNKEGSFLDVTGFWLSADTSPYFTITSSYEFISLAPDASVTCTVRYSPGEEAGDLGTLNVETRSRNALTVSLAGSGIPLPAPEIEVTPASLDFGAVLIGSSTALEVMVQNIGSDTLDIRQISFDPVTSDAFDAEAFPGGILAPGAGISFDVVYTPTSEDTDGGEIVIESDDRDEPQVFLSLAGSGVTVPSPEIEVTPRAIDFGIVLLEESRTREVVIGNTGTATLKVMDVALGDDVSEEFILIAPAGTVDIAPGSRLVVEVVYAPRDRTPDSGTLRFLSNDADELINIVSLAGSGAPAPSPEIEVTPRSLSFGAILLGNSRSMGVTVRNTGGATLHVTSVSLGTGTSPEITLEATTTRFDLEPAGVRNLTVTYTAADELPDSGSLRIASDDEDESLVVVSISGTGVPVPLPEIEVNPSSLAFGSVEVGTSRALRLTIASTGAAPLTFGSISLGSGSSPSYTITARPSSGSVLDAGQAGTVEVRYAPASATVDTGTLRITSDDPDDPVVVVPLSGTGTQTPVDTSLTLAWSAPTTKADGSSLESLTGYKLHIGRDSRNYTQTVDVGDITMHTLDSLSSGRHYIAVTAYNDDGESAHSAEISVDIP